MSTTAERLDPTATLTPTQALAWAAQAARHAANAADAFNGIKNEHPQFESLTTYYHDRAVLNAQVAQALTAYATATGRWQGR